MKRLSSWLLVLLLAASCAGCAVQPASGAASCPATSVLYVSTLGSDSNCGTPAAPLGTIAYAASRAQPGQLIFVESGVYDEQNTISLSQSGTRSAPIRLLAASGVQVIGEVSPAFKVTGSYVMIAGFDVTLGATANLQGRGLIQVGEKAPTTAFAAHVTIQGNSLHDLDNAAGSSCVGGGAVDVFPDVDSLAVIGNRIAHIGPPGACSHMHGIYSGATHAYIANNIISDVAGYAVQIWPQGDHSEIVNNDLGPARTGGIVIGTETGYSADDVYVGNNSIRAITGLYGISEIGPTGLHNTYTNNDLYQCQNAYWLNNGQPINPLSADPLYMTFASDGDGDYHLQAASPLIGAGAALWLPYEDYDGSLRGNADIGALAA